MTKIIQSLVASATVACPNSFACLAKNLGFHAAQAGPSRVKKFLVVTPCMSVARASSTTPVVWTKVNEILSFCGRESRHFKKKTDYYA